MFWGMMRSVQDKMFVTTSHRINFPYILIGFMLSTCLWIIFVMSPINSIYNEKFSSRRIITANIMEDTFNASLKNTTLKNGPRDIMADTNDASLKSTTPKNGRRDNTLLHNALLMYLDSGDGHMIQFTLFLYGSWKYVMSHKHLLSNITTENTSPLPEIIIDLVVYCHPEACKVLPVDCNPIGEDDILEDVPRCWYKPSERLQNFPGYPSNYGYINTFTFLVDDQFSQIVNRYDWILRTDTDVFISPGILGWVSKYPLVTGRGGYMDPFNKNRLWTIARKLGLRSQNISNLGSTWYGKPKLFEKAARLALNVSVYLYNNEFQKSLPGLEGIFDKGANGNWPKWWRPVSTMYGSELAINHVIPNLTENHKAVDFIDRTAIDDKTQVMKVAHIHCWHDHPDFNKFRFTENILRLIQSDVRKLWVQNETMFYRNDMDVSRMTIKDYVTYIAWNGVLKYLPHVIGPMIP